MKLSLILQAIDRMSGPARAAKAGIDDLGRRGFGGLSRSVETARGRLRGFMSDTERGERVGRRLGLRLREIADRDFAAFGRAARAAHTATGGLLKNMTLMAARGVGFGILGAGAAAGAGAGLFARGVIANAAKFEQYQVALEGTEGSAAKAKAAMEWVQKFAKATPYDIDTVTDSFVRARGVGIDPMTGAFRVLGDAAGGTRKSLMDAVEAIADAQTGEFERLKEFNITSSSKGDNVSFSYIDKAGKNAAVSVKKNMTEIRRAILDVFDKKYGGGMERQSKTLTGVWNNLQDVVTNFQLKVANAGIFDKVKSRLQAVLEWTDRLEKDGRLDAWAKRASDQLGELWDAAERFINDTDWRAVADGIGAIVSVLVTVVGWIGKAAGAWSRWQSDVERQNLNRTVNGSDWFGILGDEKAAARRRLKELDKQDYGQEQGYRSPGGRWVWPQGSATKTPGKPLTWNRAVGREDMWRRALPAPGAGQAPASPLKPQKMSLDINLKGPGAASASVGRITAPPNVSTSVNRGWAMGGPA